MNPILSRLFIILFGLLCLTSQSYSQVIEHVDIIGASEVESSQILFALETQVGDPVDAAKVIRDIKAIYKLGYFQDVRVEASSYDEGYHVSFIVVERPRIIDIHYDGRTQLSTNTIEEDLTLKKNDIYDPVKVQRGTEIIRNAYRKAGYAQVEVTSRVEEVSESEYVLYFVINESPRIFLSEIRTEGNHLYSDLEIKRFILSAEIDCFSWANESGIFQEERVNQDMAMIYQNYAKNGYIDVFIDKPQLTLWRSPEFNQLSVYLKISEGPQYFTGKVDITGDILGTKEELMKRLSLEEGDVYNPFQQNQDRNVLNEAYQEQGYAFVRIIPRIRKHKETQTVDVTYHVVKREKAYLGRILFAGNTKTRDFVIRREFEVREGELYNGKKLRRSRENMERLGFFEPGFQMKREPREDENNILDLINDLKEAQTGSFQAQLGYSERSRLSGALSLSMGNLFGRGQSLSLSLQFAEEGVTNDFSINFNEPRLWGTRVSAGIGLSLRRISARTRAGQRARSENAHNLRFGVPLYRDWRMFFRLGAVDRLFEDNRFSAVIKRSLSVSVVHNTINHPVFPSGGANHTMGVSQTGTPFGGNTRFREYTYSYQRFWALNQYRTFIAMLRVRMGALEQLGDFRIPQEDRFFLGGITSIRGHEIFSIAGPSGSEEIGRHQEESTVITETGGVQDFDLDRRIRRENLNAEEIRELRPGGINQRVINLELLFPVTTDEQNNIRGVVFFDAGNVNAENRQYELLGEEAPGFLDLRRSLGAGIRLITPVGVFRFEYGFKLDQRRGESPDKFDFNISGLF